MDFQYKLIVSNQTFYKEFEIPAELERVKLGSTSNCEFRLNSELFFEDIEISLQKKDGWNILCSDNLYISRGDARKLLFSELSHDDVVNICYVNSGEFAFQVRFLIDFEAEIPRYDWYIKMDEVPHITISDTRGSDIELESEYGKGTAVYIEKTKNGIVITEKTSQLGVNVNGKKINKTAILKDFDFFSIADFFGFYKNDKVYFCHDNIQTNKKNTIEKFRKNYKNGEFRALYKAFEYSDANKGYKLYDLIEGLQKINYETFINENKLLIVPDNCCLYINGKLQDISCEAVEQINTIFAENQHTATLGGTMSEQRLKDDAHLLEVARENVNVDILSLGFETNISVLDRMIYLLFQSQKILAENKILHIDTFDSSIIMQTEEVIKMKMMLKNVLKEEAFEQTRKHVLGVINQWLEMDPMRFNMLAVELKIENVQIIDFLNIISTVEYDEFVTNVIKMRPTVSEAQIIMRR